MTTLDERFRAAEGQQHDLMPDDDEGKPFHSVAFYFALAVIIAISVFLFAFPVRAQEVLTGRGIICDTAEQVSQIAAHRTKGLDPPAAIEQVNKDAANESACVFAFVAYIRGAAMLKVSIPEGTAEVAPILVIGFHNGMGWVQLSAPLPQFTIFLTRPNTSA